METRQAKPLRERIIDFFRTTRDCITDPSGDICPDRISAWLLATLIVGALVVAGEQVLAVGEQLSWRDFLAAGEYAPTTTEPACATAAHAADRATATRACWTGGQKAFLIGLMVLDTVWAWLFYMPLLMLLTRRLLRELSDDRFASEASETSPPRWLARLLGRRLARLLVSVLPLLMAAGAWLAAYGLPVGMAVVDTAENGIAVLAGFERAPLSLLASATKLKSGTMWFAISIPTLLLGFWFFAALAAPAGRRVISRAELRIAVGRVVWRSRYVLAMLAVFGALVIAMDQSRDVLVGMAQSFQLPMERGSGLDLGAIAVFIPVLLLPALVLWGFTSWWRERVPKDLDALVPISFLALWLLILGICALYWPITRLSANIVFSIVAVWLFAYACWLWSRILARLSTPDQSSPQTCSKSRDSDGRDHFAKWWARLLGILPFLLAIWLAGLASGDAANAHAHGMSLGLFFFAALAAALAFAIQELLTRNPARDRFDAPSTDSAVAQGEPSLYYDVVAHRPDCVAEELKRPRYRFPFWLPHAPLTLPLLALVGFQGIRALDLAIGGQMPLTLAVIALALTLWTSVLGLLAQASLRQGMPWVLLLLVLVGLYGAVDFNDNHRVLTEAYQRTGPGMLWEMWRTQAMLAVLVILALVWAWWRSIRPAPASANRFWRQYWADFIAYAGIAVLAAIVLLRADVRLAPEGSDPQAFQTAGAGAEGQAPPPGKSALAEQKDLNHAIKVHIGAVLSEGNGRQPDTPRSVYFVSAEGGGIRAAYWTALVLRRLETDRNDFPEGAFSISGVSGGSVGAAAWQVCRSQGRGSAADTGAAEDSATRQGGGCIDRLGDADLLTPLVSSWLFEDVLAMVLPTTADIPWVPLPSCKTPACGVLSRGNWFERALEASVPGIEQPIVAANADSPYLLLNSTRVETGDRAIASPLKINPGPEPDQPQRDPDYQPFPSSVDQLTVLGDGLPLSTAAHNSARFTYVNAIGSAGKRVNGHFDEGYHLADGGYFDNSGGHTTADIVRAYTWCLFGPDDPCGIDDGADLLGRARRLLVPSAIQIRNGVKPTPHGPQVSSEQCAPIPGPVWKDMDTFTGLRAPLKTLVSAIGVGANGRVAEAEICRAVRSWRLLRDEATHRWTTADEGAGQASTPLGGESATAEAMPPLVMDLDLVDRGVLYPLGWYLSPTAKADMKRAADKCVISDDASAQERDPCQGVAVK